MENRYHWILDNGHGSIDPTQLETNSRSINGKIMTSGKRSFKFPKGSKFENQCLIEGSNNRDVVNYLTMLMDQLEIQYTVLVPGYKDMSLSARCEKANLIAKNYEYPLPSILLSVHHNAFGKSWNNANGVDSFYWKSDQGYSGGGKRIAEIINPSLVKWSGLRNRGVKGRDFKILRSTTMPAVLVECGFMTNLKEAEYLMTEEAKQNTAKGLFEGIMNIEQNGY